MTDEQGGRSVLWHVPMSLDGFITGPGDAMHWARGAGSSPLGAETMRGPVPSSAAAVAPVLLGDSGTWPIFATGSAAKGNEQRATLRPRRLG